MYKVMRSPYWTGEFPPGTPVVFHAKTTNTCTVVPRRTYNIMTCFAFFVKVQTKINE